MKIWTNKYRNHWISPYVILTRVCFWERNKDRIYNLKDEDNNPYEPWVKILEPVCQIWQKFLDLVHPRIEYIKLDQWDTWSFDHTLAEIILPGLKQLKSTKHGAPFVDDKDVPEELKSRNGTKENEYEVDSLHFARWDYVLDEMIWAFEQKVTDDADGQFFDHSKTNHKAPWDPDYVSPDYDKKGHARWQKRKSNGFRLFGRYFENLWD